MWNPAVLDITLELEKVKKGHRRLYYYTAEYKLLVACVIYTYVISKLWNIKADVEFC